MLSGEKILITGISGTVGMAVARSLVGDNEVWGAARFNDAAVREQVDAAGITTVAVDISGGDLGDLPQDFTYLLHLAYYRGGADDFEQAISVNGDGTGLVLQHCRVVKAALVMSSNVVYAPHDDPWYFPKETDAIGNANVFWSPTSGTSKIAEESVARYCARAFDVPVTIARLNTIYGNSNRMLPTMHLDSVVAGREIVVRWDPNPHTPIHVDDVCEQLEALLDAAGVPALIVNWGGDEAVTVQEWCGQAAELAGTEAHIRVQTVPNSTRTAATDQAKRRSITGPSRVPFAEGFRRLYEERYPTGPAGGIAGGGGAK